MKYMIRKIWRIAKETIIKFYHDNPFIYSGAVAFFAVFSLPAILTIVVNSAGALVGKKAVRGQLASQIQEYIGQDAARQVELMIQNENASGAGTLSTAVSIGAILVSATFVFATIEKALNALWEVRARPDRFFMRLLVNRLTSLALLLVMGGLMLLSFLTQAAFLLVEREIADQASKLASPVARLGTEVFFLGLTTILFAVIFKFLPDVKIKWADVWVGALVTSVLFAIGKYIINLYLVQSNLATTYGASGAVVLLLVWIYYSCLILLFGAEFTQVYTLSRGRQIWPDEHAVKIRLQEVELDK